MAAPERGAFDEEDMSVFMRVDGGFRLWPGKEGSAHQGRGFGGGEDVQ